MSGTHPKFTSEVLAVCCASALATTSRFIWNTGPHRAHSEPINGFNMNLAGRAKKNAPLVRESRPETRPSGIHRRQNSILGGSEEDSSTTDPEAGRPNAAPDPNHLREMANWSATQVPGIWHDAPPAARADGTGLLRIERDPKSLMSQSNVGSPCRTRRPRWTGTAGTFEHDQRRAG